MCLEVTVLNVWLLLTSSFLFFGVFDLPSSAECLQLSSLLFLSHPDVKVSHFTCFSWTTTTATKQKNRFTKDVFNRPISRAGAFTSSVDLIYFCVEPFSRSFYLTSLTTAAFRDVSITITNITNHWSSGSTPTMMLPSQNDQTRKKSQEKKWELKSNKETQIFFLL